MIIKTKNGRSFDTEKDLNSAERHIVQKLFAWEQMAASLEQFKGKKEEALKKGWNGSGPLRESIAIRIITRDMEQKVSARLATG